MDSLGAKQPYTMIIEKIIHGNCIHMIEQRLQCYESDVCGAYALYFARELAKHGEPCNALEPFTTNCITNDAIIRNYVSRKFHVIL